MYFSLYVNDWNYIAFDEGLALLNGLKTYFILKNDCVPYVFCSTVLTFGMGKPRTPAGSRMEPFVAELNS